jgi:hypothetical protein
MVRVLVACGGYSFAKETRFLKLQEKCQIVRKCLKHKGHDGRCCADEGPPIYAQQGKIKLSGGHFSTAMIGYRTKIKKTRRGDDVPVRPPPQRKPTPGGRFGTALIGYRTKNGFKPNSLPGPVNTPTFPVSGGGHFSTSLMGYRTKIQVRRSDDDVPVRPPPQRKPTPGGRFGTALMGYRTKNGFKPNSLPGPVNPPSYPRPGGGHFSTALIGARTHKIKKMAGVPVPPLPTRPITPGGKFGNALIGYRTKSPNAGRKENDGAGNLGSTTTALPIFGHETPGGRFNMYGAKDRGSPIGKRPQSAPMYNVSGCGDKLLPGGVFNQSGAQKEMFRFTYLDETG